MACLAVVTSLAAVKPDVGRAAPRKVPVGFAGVDLDPWKISSHRLKLADELSIARRSGVETVRFPLYWSSVELGPGSYAWSRLDGFVAEAARNGINLVPTVLQAPAWAADSRYSGRRSPTKILIPKSFGRYADFMAALASRYGSSGSFWNSHSRLPRKPIRVWQVWNEPDLPYYWPAHSGESQVATVNGRKVRSRNFGWAATYVAMLRASRQRILAADPSAQVLMGSLTNRSWKSLTTAYSAGAKGAFDSVGVNIFASTVPQLKMAFGYVRDVMAAAGDGSAGLTVTELSWCAARGKLRRGANMSWIVTTPSGQAAQLKRAMAMIVGYRGQARINGVYWYSWISTYRGNRSAWDYSGLRAYGARRGSAGNRPALAAFRSVALRLAGR